MQSEPAGTDTIALIVEEHEFLTLYHCVIEAREALGEDEFRIRTGGSKAEARVVLEELKVAWRNFQAGGDLK